ncbi:MAG: pyruvate kinase [Myxococcota bacterium]|jgi:pyruvate kinase|nr:pyruvate kinase [Myxococcota bacterium]
MVIRTKIIATLGPASWDKENILRLARAGVDTFRLNFSHGSYELHQKTLDGVRQAEQELSEPLAVLADLCGPKIRVGEIPNAPVELIEGNSLHIQAEPIAGNASRLSTTLPAIISSVDVGEHLLLDDGKLDIEVVEVAEKEIRCVVRRGGLLNPRKGINLPQTLLKVSALTDKDRADARWIATRPIDYVALSFVQRPEDVLELRALLTAEGSKQHIIAKIEKPQAVANIDAILEVTDGIMVARGDLGVEMDLPSVPVTQKRLVLKAAEAGKPCIVATQMLESMTQCAVPTRAEVSDVANAVLDHTDAVMLSGETAVGQFPEEAVRMMDRIVSETQAYHDETYHPCGLAVKAFPTTAGLANAVHQIMASDKIAAIAVFSNGGDSARMLSKARPACPILGLSSQLSTVRRMCLYYGVYSMRIDTPEHTSDLLRIAGQLAVEKELARPGDKLIVLSGRPLGQSGATNTLVVHTIPEG